MLPYLADCRKWQLLMLPFMEVTVIGNYLCCHIWQIAVNDNYLMLPFMEVTVIGNYLYCHIWQIAVNGNY